MTATTKESMTIEIVIDDLRLKGFYDQWERVCMALPCSRVILNSSLNGLHR